MATSLTPVRKQALLYLEVAEREGRQMRVSNETNSNSGYLHWKPAGWLMETGLAEEVRMPTGTYLQITAAGRDIAAALNTSPKD